MTVFYLMCSVDFYQLYKEGMIRITNVKVSCKVQEISLDDLKKICVENKIDYKYFNNFVVFRTKEFTYTIFKKRSASESLKECKKREEQKCHCNITRCLFSNVQIALKVQQNPEQH